MYSFYSFAQSHKQAISNIAQAGDDHSLLVHAIIDRPHPHLDLVPALGHLAHAVATAQQTDHDHALDAPVPEGLDGGIGGGAGGDDRVEQDGETGGGGVGGGTEVEGGGRGGWGEGGFGEGEVVVVFDGLEADGFAEEAEVVDGDGGGEKGVDC